VPRTDRTDVGPTRRFVEWMFRSRRSGAVTVVQWPNLSLAAFIGAAVAARLVHSPSAAETVLRAIAAVALVIWALDEILRGVNPFRRMLGAGVLLATVAGLVFH
jgi:hypothetical protein